MWMATPAPRRGADAVVAVGAVGRFGGLAHSGEDVETLVQVGHLYSYMGMRGVLPGGIERVGCVASYLTTVACNPKQGWRGASPCRYSRFRDRLWRGEIDVVHEAHPGDVDLEQPGAGGVGGRVPLCQVGGVDEHAGYGRRSGDAGYGGRRGNAEGLYKRGAGLASRRSAAGGGVFASSRGSHLRVGKFDEEAESAGRARPVVYGQRQIPAHFDRYKRTVGYNTAINSRQFIRPGMDAMQVRLPWPDAFRYPGRDVRRGGAVCGGELTFEVTHTRGETEDAAWTWVPERKWLFPGDLFIWAVPNAGNPQKAQRWAGEWAAGLRQMAGKGAELMSPGHGFPIFGADRIAEALNDTADLLDSIEIRRWR